MINVLHFYKIYYPDSFGGVEQVIYQLCEGSVELDINSVVHTLSNKRSHELEKYENHSVVKSKTCFEIASTPFSYSAISKFKELAAKADIIHYHFPYPFMDMLHFLTSVSKPTVLTYHSDILKQKNWLKFYKPLMHRFLKEVDVIVATSPNYVISSNVLNNYKNKIKVIPIGINPENYVVKQEYDDKTIREKLPEKYILFIGALRYYKGLYTLIDAMENTDVTLVIVGGGPLEGKLKEYIRSKMIKNIIMLGMVSNDDKNILLKSCHAVVFPSHLRTEAFGITLLEGALFGKPLISCEIGTGTSYINIDQQTGIVVPPEDSRALKGAIEKICFDPYLANEFGMNARKRFFELFTAKDMVVSYKGVYESLI